MSEPARKIYDDELPEQPKLGVVQGGGETSAPKRGHLGVVDSGELSATELEEAEQEDTEPQTTTPDQSESSLYKPESKSKVRGKLFSKRNVITGSIAGVLVGGSFGALTILQGPFLLIHLSKTLSTKNFANHEETNKASILGLYRWAKSGNVGQTRLSHRGSKKFARIEAKLAKGGLKINVDRFTGQITTMTIDTSNTPQYRGMSREQIQSAIAQDHGLPANKVQRIGMGADGASSKFAFNLREANITSKRSALRLHIENQKLSKIQSAIQLRILAKYYNAPSWFHPLKRAGAALDQKLSTRLQRSKFFREQEAKRAKKLAERTKAANERAARIKSRLKIGAGVVGGVLLGSTAVCVAKDIAAEIPAINRDNIVVPAIKSGVDLIAIGSQVQSGQDLDLNQMGAVVNSFKDENGKTIWDSKPLLAEKGVNGGEDIDPELKQAFSPDSTAASIEKTIDKDFPGLCSDAGKIIQTVAGVGLLLVPGVGWVTKAISTAAGMVAIGAIMKYVPKLLADEPLTGTPHQGPRGGSIDAYGAREAGNVAARASAGIELSSQESAELQREYDAKDREEFRSKSFASRLFDPYDHRSLAGRLIDSQSTSPGQNITNVASGLVNMGSWTKGFSSLLFPRVHAADTVEYDYGFPSFGYRPVELEKLASEDPYANGDKAAALLDLPCGSNDPCGQDYIDRALICFGVNIQKGTYGWDAVAVQDTNPASAEYQQANCKENNNNWLLIRFFVTNTRTMASDACYEGDESACQEMGINGSSEDTTTSATTSQAIVGDPYTDSTDVPCAAGTNDLGMNTGYSNGKSFPVRLCALPNLPSTGQADSPGSRFSTSGASGFAIVNSRVSGAWFALVNDATAAGISLRSYSSFRSMSHQISLWAANPDPDLVARPGYSSHQGGVAIDFANMGIKHKGATCSNRAKAEYSDGWKWLRDNAENYGFKQYAVEAWHWDAYPSANRCGA